MNWEALLFAVSMPLVVAGIVYGVPLIPERIRLAGMLFVFSVVMFILLYLTGDMVFPKERP